jgi:DNA repair protein RadD
MNLRHYQARVVDDIRHGDLIVSPTGTGKSVMLAEIASRCVAAGGIPLVVAHRVELIHQLSNTFRAAWLTPEVNVFVRSIQELRRGNAPKATMLIVDEAHHLPSDDWSQLISEQYPQAFLVGATATPERGDGRGMGSVGFRRIVTTLTTRDAIEQGYLVKPDVLRPDRALGPGELAQDPVVAYRDHAMGTKAISFRPSVEIAVQMACRFRDELGIKAAAVWGDMLAKDRQRIIAEFASGKLQLLTSVAVLTEGFDVPSVETVILARGYGTAGGMLQAIGRGLRLAEGKTRCLVIDLRGVTHQHGEPDDERTFHLEGRGIRRPSDDIDVRFCPVCGSPVAGAECELCGHSGEMRLRPPRVLGLPIDRFARVRSDDEDQQAARLSRWMSECKAKGWKEGRALHRFKGAYGSFPAREVVTKARLLAR